MPAPGCTQLCKRPLLLLIWLFQSSSAELSWNHFKMQILTSLRFFLSCFALDGVLGWNVWDRQGGVKSKSACSLLRQLWKICSSFGLRLTTWSANILVSSHKPQLHMCTRTCVCVCVRNKCCCSQAWPAQSSRWDCLWARFPSHLPPSLPFSPSSHSPPHHLDQLCWVKLCFRVTFRLLSFQLYFHPSTTSLSFPAITASLIYLFIFCFSCLKTWHVAASVFLPRATRMINER